MLCVPCVPVAPLPTPQKREENALQRLEAQELLRELDLRGKAEVREQRIRMATHIAKRVEDTRQKRARRKIIKKFLKSAAVQMMSLEDVEKGAELKSLKEQKRKDFVARAEKKQAFRLTQIQQRICEKEERVRRQEEAKRLLLEQHKLEAKRERMARQRILDVRVPVVMRGRRSSAVEKALSSALGPSRVRSPSFSLCVYVCVCACVCGVSVSVCVPYCGCLRICACV